MSKKCEWHCCNNLVDDNKRFCHKKCKSKFMVDRRRKDLKQLAVEYKGGKCYICAYNICSGALDFHHLDKTQKDFALSHKGLTRSWEKVKEEIEKCILVCCRCHREIHHGIHDEYLNNYLISDKLNEPNFEQYVTTRLKIATIFNKKCLTCNQKFDTKIEHQKYCSRKCHTISRRKIPV